MAAPVFVDAGAGVSIASGNTLSPVCPSTINAGDCLILHTQVWNATMTVTTPTGWTLISGPNDYATDMRAYVYGKIADGSEGGSTISVIYSGTLNEKIARIYHFSGTDVGSTFWEALSFATDVGSGVLDTGVTTIGIERLALNLVGLGQATTATVFAGQSGGTWVEAVAEYAANVHTLQLQTAAMPTAGTINGGSMSIGVSSRILVYGFALKPWSMPLDKTLPDADVTTTGWATAPLFSKVNDASDATIMTATAV